jgi:hypothetical protein
MLASNRIFSRYSTLTQMLFDGGVQRRQTQAVLPHPLKQPDDIRHVGGDGYRGKWASGLELTDREIRRNSRVTRRQDFFRESTQVFDEGQPQDTRPRPQLADSQWRNRLIAVHEADELGAVEAAIAVPDELESHRVHSRVPRPLPLRKPRKLSIVRLRKVLAHGADFCRHQIEVIEQPLGRRCDVFASVHVASQGGVRSAQDASVVGQARKEALRSP